MKFIRWFNEIGKSEVGLVGGKGANLGELTRAGLPVPGGFCVTSEAYRDFIHLTGLDQLIMNALEAIHLDDLEDIKYKSSLIQSAILRVPILPEIRDEITACYHQLTSQMSQDISLAVRSSVTVEDQANASFAGQLETYLNIHGVPALLEHIKLCWASLWAERVVSYIANQGLDHRLVSMSVVVQTMIPSEVAGVLFTVNPVSGRRDEVVINSSWGLGEAIVSGMVTPDTIIARKSDGSVISRQIGVKERMVSYAADGGTEELPVPDELRARTSLLDQQIAKLTVLANRIEDYYTSPQDIEWGYYKGEWYLLQSRPITALAQTVEHSYPPGEFNRTMLIEIFPDPLSPAFLSVIEPLFKEMLDFTICALGFEPPEKIQAIGGFHYQPYFNRDYIAAAFQPLTSAVREPLIAQIINPFGSDKEVAQIELSWLWLSMAYRMLRFMVHFPRQLLGLLATYQAEIDEVEEYPYQIAGEAEICQQIYRLPFEYANKLLNYDFLMIAVIGRSYRLLGSILKRFYKADTDEVVAKLISGVTGNITMETNKRLWDLAQIARSNPSIGAIVWRNNATRARMLLQHDEAGQKFILAMDQFLDEFGHREVHMDILYPTWCDDPEPVYSFIRSYLDADESQSPYQQQERLIREREQLTRMVIKDVERSITGRLFLASVFRWILRQTQIHTRERDTMHFEMTRLFPPLRRLMLELGKRWQERGLLDQTEDIFYLKIDEIMQMPEKPLPMQSTVRIRKYDFAYAQNHACPNIIRNGEEIFGAQARTEDAGASGLQGIAGSPGVVTGITRIIQGPDEFTRLKKGEILVAPITNPVWTPLFAVASGVITEVGGILSHGAIVAREYGIPAVMSVAGVTRLLHDGQRVTVDGNKGVVILEQEA